MADYELIYFGLNGRATGIRLMLDHLQIPFTDSTIPYGDREKYVDSFKFKRLPVLKIASKKLEIPQTMAIYRYIGSKYGLIGETLEEKALLDAFADQIQECASLTGPWVTSAISETPEGMNAKFKQILPEILYRFVNIFSKQLQENGTGYLVGKKLTWVDFALASFTHWIYGPAPDYGKDALKPMLKHRDLVFSLPNIQQRLKDSQKYPF